MPVDMLEKTTGKYSPEEVERGLQAMVALASAPKAAQATGIPARTLQDWKAKRYRTRYLEIRNEVAPQIQAEMAAEAEDLARRYAQLEHNTIDDIERDWDNLKTIDKMAAARSWTVSRGISIDKANILRGLPTQRIEHSIDDTTARLIRLGINVIDGDTTEQEPTDAQLAD